MGPGFRRDADFGSVINAAVGSPAKLRCRIGGCRRAMARVIRNAA
jgi:hypothetical protein